MNPDELSRLFDTFERSVFRLETLPVYTVPGETERSRAFIESRSLPPRSPSGQGWLRRIADGVGAGKRWYRVHIIDLPLTDYLRFEIASYAESVALGYETYLVDREAHPGLAELRTDFWAFDLDTPARAVVVLMHYDDEGRPLRAEQARDDLERYRCQRDLAMAHAVRLDEYVMRHRERLTIA